MWLRTVQAVLWSFLVVRKASEYEKDIKSLNPFAIIAVGFAMAIVFAVSLIVIVNLIV
jgi:hypothetical protein